MTQGTALATRTADANGSQDIFPDAAPCIPAAGATDYSDMRARCDWCGMEVEVLASGRCLLGHAIASAEAFDLPAAHGASPAPAPRRGRRRRAARPPEPDAGPGPVSAEKPEPGEESRSVRTAPTPPKLEHPPTREWPAAQAAPPGNGAGPGASSGRMPRVSRPWAPVEPDGPSGPVDAAFDPGPGPMFEVAAPSLGAPVKIESPPEPTAPRSEDVEQALRDLLAGGSAARPKPAPDQAEARQGTRRLRLPFRRAEGRRAAVERPQDLPAPARPAAPKIMPPQTAEEPPAVAPTEASAEPAQASAETAGAAAAEPPAKPKARAPLIDSLAPLTAKPAKPKQAKPEPRSKAGAKKAKPKPEPAAAPEATPPPLPQQAAQPEASPALVIGVPTTYRRPRRVRGGPLSPRNTVAWGLAIAAMFSAGVAALVLSPGRAEDGGRLRPGRRQIALTAVQDYAVRPDPQSESRLRAELAAQGSVPRQLAASTVVDPENGDVVALYQAIVFSSDVVKSQRDLDEFLRLFAEGAGITADAFAERVLGRRTVWAGLLDQGQAVIVFSGPEVVIVITASVGAAGDELADAVLLARGL